MKTIDFKHKLNVNVEQFDKTRKHRFIFGQSFEIYNGSKGLFDYGPVGCAVKNNLIQAWKQHFIIEDGMLEIESTCLTPKSVFEASGHCAKFMDTMIQDITTNENFRADHLLEDALKQIIESSEVLVERKTEAEQVLSIIESLSQQDLDKIIKDWQIKSPNGNDLSEVFMFNLMFDTCLGPIRRNTNTAYLRPETAQGIFMNFKRLLDFNGGNLPFAVAQIGLAFRNEIAPRNGLLRVCEFQMAEIEHFCDPNDKTHLQFDDISDVIVNLFTREQQTGQRKLLVGSIKQALNDGLIGSQLLAYYMAKTQLFLESVGVLPENIRFRQHLAKEMAHYACDCWDAELLTSFGWIECVGHADRSCYDLEVHSKCNPNGEQLTVFKHYDQPLINCLEIKPDKGNIGREFKEHSKVILETLNNLNQSELEDLQHKLLQDDVEIAGFTLHSKHIVINKVEHKQNGRFIFPHVVEPSFGIGRIVFAILEQSFYIRDEDKDRSVLRLSPTIASVKVIILPLMVKPELQKYVNPIQIMLRKAGISCKAELSGASIGKRYSRNDEIGIPFAVTIDYDTIKDNTVTVRERDSTDQIRVNIDQLVKHLLELLIT